MEVEREDPDAVFLQEVVPDTMAIIESKLINYKCVQAGGEGYFVAMMLKNSTGLNTFGSSVRFVLWSPTQSSNFLRHFRYQLLTRIIASNRMANLEWEGIY